MIEILIAVAIVGVLVAAAIPAYGDYRVRSKVVNALTAAASLRTAVGVCIHDAGGMPAGCNTSTPAVHTVVPVFTPTAEVASASVAAGVITLILASGLGEGVDGRTITITPNVQAGGILWTNTTTVTHVAARATIEKNNP